MPRSPRLLVYTGLLGLLFFWLTDPRFGLAGMTASENVRDAMNQARAGTVVGLVGSLVIFLVGAWLMTRRTA